jgi:phosphoglycolate phosphatase-like HAD superfamily hydrolase
MEYTEKYTEQHFIEFKEQLALLAQEEYNACSDFTTAIEKASEPKDLMQVLHNYVEEIFERLGGQHDTSDSDSEIDYLQSQVENLEVELSEYDDVKETLHGEMKFKTFIELHEKYTPWEFEQLLLNGKL